MQKHEQGQNRKDLRLHVGGWFYIVGPANKAIQSVGVQVTAQPRLASLYPISRDRCHHRVKCHGHGSKQRADRDVADAESIRSEGDHDDIVKERQNEQG